MADETSPAIAVADALSALLYAVAGWGLIGMGALGIVTAIVGVLEDAAASTALYPAVALAVLSLLSIAAGTYVHPRVRRRYGVSRFGSARRVDRRVIHADEDATERCVVCGARAERGLVWRYCEEYVVAGAPLHTASEQYNHYCLECATEETGIGDENVGDTPIGRSRTKKHPGQSNEISRRVYGPFLGGEAMASGGRPMCRGHMDLTAPT